jgi:hypothetical protein
MNDVTAFVPRAQANARQRIADFIALSRDRLTVLVPREAWDGDVWDVSTSFVRKGKQRVVSKLHFFKYGTLSGWCGMGGGDPFEKPFAEFARAFIRYQHSAAPLGFGSLRTRIGALSHIDAAFKSLGKVSDISLLSADVLHAAVRVSRGDVSPAVRYHRAAMIRSVFLFCLEHGFIAAPFVWKHGVRKTQNIGSRIGDEPAKRRAAKLPGGEELDILALAFCEPKNVRDNLLSAVTAICICVPIRIHEVLQLSVDCGCDVERRSDKAEMVSTFGLRVLPGKHTAPQMKWLPDVMAELGRQAVSRLQQISAPARVIAEWYVRNPTKLYLPPDAQHLRQQKRLDAAVIGNLVGTVVPDKWAKAMNIPFERLTRALGASPSNSSDQTGQAILPYGNEGVHASPLLAGPRFRPYLSGVRGGSAWGLVGHSPRRSRRAQDQRADQPAKQRRIRTIGGKRQLDPGRRLLDPHRDLQQPQTDGGEFAIG